MKLSKKQIEQLKKTPTIRTRIKRINSGEYVLHETIITDIKPIKYYKAIVD